MTRAPTDRANGMMTKQLPRNILSLTFEFALAEHSKETLFRLEIICKTAIQQSWQQFLKQRLSVDCIAYEENEGNQTWGRGGGNEGKEAVGDGKARRWM